MIVQPMEARIAHLEGAFEQVNARLNSIDRNLADLRSESSRHFTWTIGMFVGSMTTTVALWVTTMLTILYHPSHP